jgi:hypothetical protein
VNQRMRVRPLIDIPLLDLMRAEYSWAKRLLNIELALLILVVILSVLGVFVDSLTERLTWVTAVLALLAYFSRWGFERSHAFAEQVRRALALEDGLGRRVDTDTEREFRSKFSYWANWSAGRAAPNTGRYFDSDLPVSPLRMLANLRESLFWQHSLAGFASSISMYILAIVFVVSIGSAYLGLTSLDDNSTRNAVAKTVLVLLLFGVSGGLLKLWRDHAKQAEELGVLVAEAKSLADHPGEVTDVDVVRLVQEYNSIVLLGPAVPDVVYDLRKNELNRLWALWKRNQ